MSQAPHSGSPEARRRLHEFLARHFGEEISHPKLGRIAVRDEVTRDFDIAETFAVDTVRAIDSGNPADGLMSGGIVVPKDGSPVHWAPTTPAVEDYVKAVADGERWWSSGGAEPVTEVIYYGLLTPGRTRSNPSGILRRRTAAGRTTDEVFTRNLRWEPTDYFRKYELGHNEDEHVEITPGEAAEFVRRIRSKLAQS
ncbi:hypothetical protein HUO13_03140 [Saccharopolyspora erythraea]|uniref:hypothetical protein n=1 Tax=Saccharopolyspora erythraea TaxID=1836 RepID=UPI001BA49FCA|nr:hypothetical protein [Saccharopolyspora erythraea]QUG99933.1 hypothetical protein HUO13_03140 [Saccharopolyspora erythraea]